MVSSWAGSFATTDRSAGLAEQAETVPVSDSHTPPLFSALPGEEEVKSDRRAAVPLPLSQSFGPVKAMENSLLTIASSLANFTQPATAEAT